MDADNVKGWCTYLRGGGESCHGDPITACKAQYDDQALGTTGFQGAAPQGNGNTRYDCKWVDLVYPSYVRFVCDSGNPQMPFACSTSDDATKDDHCEANPIEIISGRKIEAAQDFATADGLLEVRRVYTSKRPFGNLIGGVMQFGGTGWSFDFGPQLALVSGFGTNQRLWLNLADGRQYGFVYDSGSSSFVPIDNNADARRKTRFTVTLVGGPPVNWSSINSATSTWTVVDRDEGVTYTIPSRKRPSEGSFVAGAPTTVAFRGGYTWTIAYGSDAEITSITDVFGRTLTFSWYSGIGVSGTYNVLIKQIVLPDGTALNYTYKKIWTSIYGTVATSLYDVMTKVEHVINPVGSGPSNVISDTTYHYEDGRFPYHLTGVTDGRAVRYATWTYDAKGRATEAYHGTGQDSWSFAYTDVNSTTRTRTLTNALGKDTIYTFSRSDPRWLLTDVDGQASANCVASNSTFTYTAKLVDTATDEEGRVTRYQRNADGLSTQIIEAYSTADARQTDITWTADHQISSHDRPGLSTDYTYDLAGRLATVTQTDTTSHSLPYVTNGDTRVWAYSYTAEGLLESIDGPLPGTGDTVEYTYDADGYLETVTNELGHVAEITSVDDLGRPLAVEDPNGIVTTLSYTDAGYLETIVVDPMGAAATTTMGYDGIGQLTSLSRSNGESFAYTYDAARRLTSTTDGKGNVLSYGYNDMGNTVLTEIENAGTTVLYSQAQTFDELGRLLTSVGVASATWEYEYDKVSNLVGATDPRNNETSYAYNRLNELIETVDEATNEINLTRDGQGEVVEYLDPRSIETAYVRNGWGEVIQEESPDIGSIVYERNELGLVTKRTDAKSNVRNYAYDDAGRLTAISFPSSGGEDVAFDYDDTTGGNLGVGRLTSFDGATGTTTRVYNSLGLIESEQVASWVKSGTTAYEYDEAGNIIEMTYPSGRVVTYTHDGDGEIDEVETQLSGLSPVETLASSVTWQPFGGGIKALSFGNGLDWDRSFDLNYRLSQQKLLDGVTPMIQRSYAYGDGLNLTEAADDLDPSKDETYSYTDLNMLETAVGPYGEDVFTYDGVGNINGHVNEISSIVTDNQADYSPTANHMTSIEQNGFPVRSFTYDANGNIETDTILSTTTEYRYGHADRMYAVERNNVRLGEYYYNAFGQLFLRIVTNTAANGWIVYFYDLGGHPIAEYDGNTGDLLREYVWLGDTPIAVIEAGSPATTYYIHTDHIGRPMAMTDDNGSFVNETDYVVFGNTWAVSGTVAVDLRFPGQMYQHESGLFYNWNRQYDPSTARYTQPDPLGLVDGPSRYAYVGNDPMQKIDPDGKRIDGSGLIPPDSPVGRTSSDAPRCALGDDFCREEERKCRALCQRARFDPDMNWIYFGSMEKCMGGCLPHGCGGNLTL